VPAKINPTLVDIEYNLRGPQIVRATDSTGQYRNRGSASARLLGEVFDKILEHRKSGTSISLTVDDNNYIVAESTSSKTDESAKGKKKGGKDS